MEYVLQHPIPVPWLLADILTLLLTLVVVVFIVQRSRHPAVALLEGFGFVFLYAGIFENFAVVNGWYVYGRSLLMLGDVPLSVPLIEMDVLLCSLWLMEKMEIPDWCKPFVAGLMGMLQDFSLDPIAVRQVFTSQGLTSGRWSWLLPAGAANIFGIPVYNFPGWMLIMLYASVWILLGRWWFKRSDYNAAVGYTYPLLAGLLALLTMITPLSQFLLWLAPLGSKGGSLEWVMLVFHLLFPALLLVVFWRGRMRNPVSLWADFPILAVPLIFHLGDILATLAAGETGILWLVLLAGLLHCALLGTIWLAGKRARAGAQAGQAFRFAP